MTDKIRPSVSGSNTTPLAADQNDSDTNKERRRALVAAISAVGVSGATQLPKQWSRPVVDHVLLPAHAQTTTSTTTTSSTSEPPCEISCTSGIEQLHALDLSSDGTDYNYIGLSATTFTQCLTAPSGSIISTISTSFTSYIVNLIFFTTYPGTESTLGALSTFPGVGTISGGSTTITVISETSFTDSCITDFS